MAYWCIYQITNNINGKRYIGQHRYEDETNPMNGYSGSGILLKRAYIKYGKENFTTEILYKRILNRKTADSMEKYAIAKHNPEYNISIGGTGGMLWRNKEDHPLIKYQREHGNAFLGRKHTKESLERMSASKRGKKSSDETKKKLSEVHKGQLWWNNGTKQIRQAECPGEGWVRGRLPYSKEWRENLSKSLKGREFSDEWKRSLSKANYARWARSKGDK